MNKKQSHWENMYKMPLEKIPWEIEEPPRELKRVIKQKTMTPPGTILDIACGSGNYSLYLASLGFSVTGIDVSKRALKIARRRAREEKLTPKFVFGNALEMRKVLQKQFDYILDYSFLHHIPLYQTKRYARQFVHLLKPGGRLLLVCYSEKDPQALGRKMVYGKYGNSMYFRTADEICEAYTPLKKIKYHKAKLGKRLHHLGHAFIFEKSE
jgi:2-polyprenyl-3-methyl-5-hydroxy-6-metoxy-1,4-benzoquinol methylase